MAARRRGMDGAEIGQSGGGEDERGGYEEWRRGEGEEFLDCDTRLSRASRGKVGGPRLRRS